MLSPVPGISFRRDVTGDGRYGLSRDRIAAYQEAFQQSALKLGLGHAKERYTFFMVDSVGLLNRGNLSGYVRCAVDVAPRDVDRFAPCLSHQESEESKYDPRSGASAYSFMKLANDWFAYDEGPS